MIGLRMLLSHDTRGPDPPKHYQLAVTIARQDSHSPCEVNIAHIYTSSCQTNAWNQGILDQIIKLILVKCKSVQCTDTG